MGKAQTFNVDVASVFELQQTDPAAYKVHSVWNGAKGWEQNRVQELHAGKSFPVHLAPFEVIALEILPAQ